MTQIRYTERLNAALRAFSSIERLERQLDQAKVRLDLTVQGLSNDEKHEYAKRTLPSDSLTHKKLKAERVGRYGLRK